MSRTASIMLSTGLIGTGVLAWAYAGLPLLTDPDLKAPLNPLGINGSPYGEVFAMAMQGPIDTEFHGVMAGNQTHNHADGETGEKCESQKSDFPQLSGFANLLTSLEKASELRTNPKAPSDVHKRYLRRKVEDKLRFAYGLDPAHYANYNSLHFFLTEPQLGTRPELTPSAAKLAEETIQYCLKQQDDPRPALTAAAAASNILELMFNDRLNPTPKFTTGQMHQYLGALDHCINRYLLLAKHWDETKNWELLSPQRISECDERFNFICKFRETAATTIGRFEGKTLSSQVSN